MCIIQSKEVNSAHGSGSCDIQAQVTTCGESLFAGSAHYRKWKDRKWEL